MTLHQDLTFNISDIANNVLYVITSIPWRS